VHAYLRELLSAGVGEQFPEAQIRFVVARGLRNDVPWPEVAGKHEELAGRIAAGEWQPFTEQDPCVASWHDAYRLFGTNPRRMRPSLDALSRRLGKSGRLPAINGAVDAYNLVSVVRGMPAGAFDLDRLVAEVVIRFSEPGDAFTPMGEPDKSESPNPGEVVYAQGGEVLTRHWNYRDADPTKVSEATRNAVFILERISGKAVPDTEMAAAQEELAGLLAPHADTVTLAVLDAGTPVTELADGEPGQVVHGQG
jgi:DNA/RNA-binding domain of Phe-tRNA-synthetase-like protein